MTINLFLFVFILLALLAAGFFIGFFVVGGIYEKKIKALPQIYDKQNILIILRNVGVNPNSKQLNRIQYELKKRIYERK